MAATRREIPLFNHTMGFEKPKTNSNVLQFMLTRDNFRLSRWLKKANTLLTCGLILVSGHLREE